MGPGGNGRVNMEVPNLGGPISQGELQKRQKLEFDIVLLQNIQNIRAVVVDLIRITSDEWEHSDMMDASPDKERHNTAMLRYHADIVEMELHLLEKIRKKLKDMEPFTEMKNFNLRDIKAKE